MAGGTFVELSVKLSRFLIWHMVTILRGRCSTADASGSFFVAVAVLQRLRRKNGRSLFSHIHCSFFVAPAVFGENLTCARATLSSLCVCRSLWGGVIFEIARATLSSLRACQIALAVARRDAHLVCSLICRLVDTVCI